MPLDESQIVRFSRQILLRAVGGRGQEALVSARVRVTGAGEAIATACAYSAAGGSSVEALAPVRGFPIAPHRPLSGEMGAIPDARFQSPDVPLPDTAQLDETVVVIADGGLVAAPAQSCTSCVLKNVSALRSPPARDDGAATSQSSGLPPPVDLIGALAALAHQRIVLGLERELRRIEVAADGSLQSLPALRCEAHR
ncbi:MAG: hypothetical protein IRZ16_00775 [Myxococcaceae bacterium]|nr:hypothetical protein [Myxococcaceae bacterium]